MSRSAYVRPLVKHDYLGSTTHRHAACQASVIVCAHACPGQLLTWNGGCITIAACSLALHVPRLAMQGYRQLQSCSLALQTLAIVLEWAFSTHPLDITPRSNKFTGVTELSIDKVACTTLQPVHRPVGCWCGVAGDPVVEGQFLAPGSGPLPRGSRMSLTTASQAGLLGTFVLNTRVTRMGLCLMAGRRQCQETTAWGAQRHCTCQPSPSLSQNVWSQTHNAQAPVT